MKLLFLILLLNTGYLSSQTNSAFLDSLLRPQLSWIGKSLPGFVLKTPADSIVNSDDLIGKPMVINFWFANCPPCIMEIPMLNNLKSNYHNQDVVFLAMTFENRETTIKFLEKNKFDFVQLCNSKEYIDQFTNFFPLTIFVDRKGIIRDIKAAELTVDPDFATNTKKNSIIPEDYLTTVDEISK